MHQRTVSPVSASWWWVGERHRLRKPSTPTWRSDPGASPSRQSWTSWLELEVSPLSVEEGLQGKDGKMVGHVAIAEAGQALLWMEEDRRLQMNSGLHAASADLGFDESKDQKKSPSMS